MLIIKLTKGQETIIDDIDSDLVKFKWFPFIQKRRGKIYGFYAARQIKKDNYKTLYMHRVIMEIILGRPLEKDEQVDRINLNKLDNRRENLRLATNANNSMNKLKQSNNTSGYKGVTWNKEKQKWKAYIVRNKKQKHLGYFSNIEDAAEAYRIASEKYHGEFGRTE